MIHSVQVTTPEVSDNCSISNDFALDFDGNEDYVALPITRQSLGNNWTMSAWIKYNGSANGEYQAIFGGVSTNFFIGKNRGNTSIGIQDGQFNPDYGGDLAFDGQWHQISVTKQNSIIRLYLDGQLISSKSVSSNGSGSIWLGLENQGSPRFAFTGLLDNVSIWNIARTPSQILIDFTSSPIGNENGLVAHYNFEDGLGSTILTDNSLNSNDGTLANMDPATDWVSSDAPITNVSLTNDFNGTADASGVYPVGTTTVTWTATDAAGNTATLAQTVTAGDEEDPAFVDSEGATITSLPDIVTCDTQVQVTTPLVSDNCNLNKALDFDGTNEYVSTNFNFSEQNFSIQFWINPEANQKDFANILDARHTGGQNWVVQQFQNQTNRYWFFAAGTPDLFFNVPPNTWTHVTLIIDQVNSLKQVYLNGVLEVATNKPQPIIYDPNPTLRIGGYSLASSDLRAWNGQIDELRIWNRVLSNFEVTSLYDQILIGNEPGLAAYYNFEDGIGSTVLTDKSQNSNDGTLANMDPATDWISSDVPISNVSLTNDFNGTADASGVYPVGTTTVTWTATDAAGNIAEITQSITVGGSEPPELSFINLEDSSIESCSTNITVPVPNVSDDCDSNDKYALDFDGFNDYVRMNSVAPAMAGSTIFTIEFWVNANNLYNNNQGGLFAINTSFGDNRVLFMTGANGTNNRITIYDGASGNHEITGPIISDNSWHHVAYARNGGTAELFVDGISYGTHTANYIFTAGDLWSLGQEFDGGPNTSDFIDGQYDEVRIWSVAKSQTQIQELMNKSISGNEDELVLAYGFEAGFGSSLVLDKSGNGYNGQLVNMDPSSDWVESTAPISPLSNVILTNDFNGTADASGVYPVGTTTVTWTATDAAGNTSTLEQTVIAGDDEAPVITCESDTEVSNEPGECFAVVSISSPTVLDNCNSNNYALDFDGSNDRVVIPSSESLTFTTEMTLQAWIYPEKNNYSRIMSNYVGGGNTSTGEFVFDTYNQSAVNGRGLRFEAINGSVQGISVPNVLTLNSWNHVSVTFNNGEIRLFVNGAYVGGTTVAITDLEIGGKDFILGEDRIVNVPEYYDGAMDDVRIWNRALPDQEILNSFDKALIGTEPGLKVHYDFEDGPDNASVSDRSGNGNNGNLSNMDPVNDWIISDTPTQSVSISYTIDGASNGTSDPSGIFPAGQTEIVWTATDASGNSSSCTQIVTVNLQSDVTDSSLNNLEVEGFNLIPAFSPDVFNYAIEVCNANSVNILASSNNPNALIVGDGIQSTGLGQSTFQVEVEACSASSTYTIVLNNSPTSTWYADNDGDGFGDANATVEDCSPPTGFVGNNADCNDDDSNINPDASEIYFNDTDDDCNAETVDFNSGIFETYVQINDQFYDLDGNVNSINPDLEGANLGDFSCKTGLNLEGGQNKIFKCLFGAGDVINGKTYYRIYLQGETAPAFTELGLGFGSDDGVSSVNDECVNQTWETSGQNINLLSSLTQSGTYVLEVYNTADYTFNTGSGTHFSNNGGNNFKASFTYTDNPPVAIAAPFTVQLDASGNGSIIAEDIDNNSTDDCGIASLEVIGQTSFDCDDVDTDIFVTLRVTDNNGVSTDSDPVRITVEDNIPPTIECPEGISGVVATSAAGAIVSWNVPVGIDNCSVTTTLTSDLDSGSTFPIGTTAVTYTATDASGNQATCSFNVEVIGVAPSITCPSDIAVTNDPGLCGASVVFAASGDSGIPAAEGIVYTIVGRERGRGNYFTILF